MGHIRVIVVFPTSDLIGHIVFDLGDHFVKTRGRVFHRKSGGQLICHTSEKILSELRVFHQSAEERVSFLRAAVVQEKVEACPIGAEAHIVVVENKMPFSVVVFGRFERSDVRKILIRKDHDSVDKQDFLDAIDRIIGGLENRSKIIQQSEKRAIAIHEAGHATCSWLLEHAHPLLKVTIVPRGKALGAAWYLPKERQITTREQLMDQMCSLLGGRAAEELTFGQISTGAQNDLERATKQAYAMVSIFGMSEKVGNVSYYDSTGQSGYGFTKPYLEKTAELIDKEAKELIDSAYNRAKELLANHKEQHEELAQLLLEREVIFSDDLEKILGKRPWDDEEEKEVATEEPQEPDTGRCGRFHVQA